MLGKPRPRRAIYAPCFTPAGPAAFARDPESSRQVWSAEAGYPGEPAYRDFYRDIGFDLPPEYVWPGGKTPRFTGIKYHRITGRGVEKELYNRRWAVNAAHAHAQHFLESRTRQMHDLGDQNFDPIVLMPFDAELFGHWWYEGPLFLECFIRKAAARDSAVRLTTPSEYLQDNPTQETVQPAASSWGEDGYWSVWLEPKNAWIYPHLHTAARRMTEAARAHAAAPGATADRVLKQLARELLLAQSSDWAFLIKTGTAKHYAARRTTDHIERFTTLHAQLTSDRVDEAFLADCEWRDNLFPNVDWRHYI
jgi:1,4-alpha-glucan branching enzyme